MLNLKFNLKEKYLKKIVYEGYRGLCDKITDKGAFDLFVPLLIKATTGGPNKGRNRSHVTQDSAYKYGQDHRVTFCRSGQTAFLPARLQHLKNFLSCHMKPVKAKYFLPCRERPSNVPQLNFVILPDALLFWINLFFILLCVFMSTSTHCFAFS